MIPGPAAVGAMLDVGAGALRALVGASSPPPWESWQWHPMWGMMGAWGIGMMVFILLFWGVMLAALLLVLRWLTHGRDGRRDAALEILRERYARGEIDRDEFEAKRRDLR